MLSVEQTLTQRLPWLALHPRIRRPVAGLLERLADEAGFNRTLTALQGLQGFDFVERALDMLGVSYRVAPRELEHIPLDGPLLVVANHPLGMVDAIALLHLVGSVRSDVRILGNEVLAILPQLQGLMLSVDVFGGGAPSRLRDAYRTLQQGGGLLLFPSGEVSRMGAVGVRDGRWSEGFARLALRTGAPVLPVHIEARNSAAFYGVSMLAKPLATAMLPREALARRGARIDMRIGALIDSSELSRRSEDSAQRAARLMRRHVYRLATQHTPIFGGQAPLAHPLPAGQVRAELQARGTLLAELSDGKQIVLLPGASDSATVREIGRLRELTFRRVGEGTGRRRDLDAYDAHYEHLLLWDPRALSIVGAYRLGHTGRILAERGMPGLYSASLFEYSPKLHCRLRQGLELGRSFIAPAYWRSRALDQLWQGIGLYLQRHADVRHLFGAVSLSASLPREARDWIVATYQHYFGVSGLGTARYPFQASPAIEQEMRVDLIGLGPAAGLEKLRQRLDTMGTSLPVLYRQYVDLVESDGIQFLGFGEDAAFSGCVDGLVMLDLQRLKPAKRSRYLGRPA